MLLYDRNQSIRFMGILVGDAGTDEIEDAKSAIDVEAKKKKLHTEFEALVFADLKTYKDSIRRPGLCMVRF